MESKNLLFFAPYFFCMNEIYLNLGCFGRQEDDFISCSGIDNCILSINEKLYNYKEIMDYLDSYNLFDKQLFDNNAIKHFIYNMQNKFDYVGRPLWLPSKFSLYERFIYEHKMCGTYIKLSLDKKDNVFEHKPVLILPKKEPEDPVIKKVKIIGRR